MPLGINRFTGDERLKTKGDYERVFQTKFRWFEGGFLVLAVPNGLLKARLGISAPRKHIPRAFARNRIKRLIRESFRHHKSELIGWDVVAVAGKGSHRHTNKEIFTFLEKHWSNLGRCKGIYSDS